MHRKLFLDTNRILFPLPTRKNVLTTSREPIEMKAFTVIALRFPSKKRLEMVMKALKPETEMHPSTRRSRVQVASKQNTLILNFEAEDTPALRASINSYLRWITLINDSFQTMEELSKK